MNVAAADAVVAAWSVLERRTMNVAAGRYDDFYSSGCLLFLNLVNGPAAKRGR